MAGVSLFGKRDAVTVRLDAAVEAQLRTFLAREEQRHQGCACTDVLHCRVCGVPATCPAVAAMRSYLLSAPVVVS